MRNTNKIRKLAHYRKRLEHASRFYQHAKWLSPARSMVVDLARFDGTAEIDTELIRAGGFELYGYARKFRVPTDRFEAFVEALKAADASARIDAPRARVTW